MKIAILGDAEAMGALLGGTLAKAGVDVTLVDVAQAAVDNINANGLRIDDKAGETHQIRVRTTTDPAGVGLTDYVLVFVKCYHIEKTLRKWITQLFTARCVAIPPIRAISPTTPATLFT